jgi:hypothetical protein
MTRHRGSHGCFDPEYKAGRQRPCSSFKHKQSLSMSVQKCAACKIHSTSWVQVRLRRFDTVWPNPSLKWSANGRRHKHTLVSILDILVTPGAAIGCVVGIALSAGLQWLFPNESMVPAQALIVVVCSVLGLVLEHRFTDRPPNR